MKKDGIVKPKKTITKPVYWKIFVCVFIVAIVVSFLLAQYYLIRKKNDLNIERRQDFENMLDDVVNLADDLTLPNYYSQEYGYLNLRWLLSRLYLYEPAPYVEVYLYGKKVMDTTEAPPCVLATNRSLEGNWYPYAYYLKDVSYLEPIREYLEQGYHYEISAAYLDPVTHTFVPDYVHVFPEYGREAEGIKIKCRPDDLDVEDYIYKSLFYFVWPSETILQEVEPQVDRVRCLVNIDDMTYEVKDMAYPYEKEDGASWSIRYKDFQERSVKDLFPTKRWVVSGIALASAVVGSFIISLILYFRRKTLFEIFDYRKKTTEAMAHDLKTPLATISAYAESLEEGLAEEVSNVGSSDPAKENKNAEYARKIRENVNDMNDMVEGILQFSKSEGSGGKVVSKETDIREIIDGCLIKYSELFEKKKIIVSVNGETPSRKTDPKLLSQAIDNLFSNCARYADEESTVKIDLSENDIKISNRFSGEISNLQDLKKPFVKGETSRSQKGSGLGLSIADNDLRLLGYKLDLTFENGIFTAIVGLR